MGALAPLVPTPMYRSGLPVWSACLVCLSGLSACLVCLSGLSACLVCLSGLSACLVCLSGLSACLVCLSGLSVCLVCLSGLYVWSVCLVCLSVCGGSNSIFALSAVCTNQVLICCLNIEFLYNVFILCALLYLNGSLFYSLVAWAPWYLCLVHLQGFIQRGGGTLESPPPSLPDKIDNQYNERGCVL